MTSEELKYAISVMTASSNGACIQMKYKDESEWKSYAGGSGFSWEWGTFDYRVEPAKTLRPWTPGEALAGLSHSTDGGKTWLRCGVEVDV